MTAVSEVYFIPHTWYFLAMSKLLCNMLFLICPLHSTSGQFIPIKTPLDSQYDIQIPEKNRFSINSFFKSLKTSKVMRRP